MKDLRDTTEAKKIQGQAPKMRWSTPELKKFSRKGIIKGGSLMGLLENATYKTS